MSRYAVNIDEKHVYDVIKKIKEVGGQVRSVSVAKNIKLNTCEHLVIYESEMEIDLDEIIEHD
jgi:hypothetical protein